MKKYGLRTITKKQDVCCICQSEKFEFVLYGMFANYNFIVCASCSYDYHLEKYKKLENYNIQICEYCYVSGKYVDDPDPLILRRNRYYFKACSKCQFITLFQETNRFSSFEKLAQTFIIKFSRVEFFYQYLFDKLDEIFITILALQRYSLKKTGFRISYAMLEIILNKSRTLIVFKNMQRNLDKEILALNKFIKCKIKYQPINFDNW